MKTPFSLVIPSQNPISSQNWRDLTLISSILSKLFYTVQSDHMIISQQYADDYDGGDDGDNNDDDDDNDDDEEEVDDDDDNDDDDDDDDENAHLGLHDKGKLAKFTALDVAALDPPLQALLIIFMMIDDDDGHCDGDEDHHY